MFGHSQKQNIAIGVGVVLILGIGVLRGRSQSTTTMPTVSQSALELTQAQQVETIAKRDASVRVDLGGTASTITNCRDLEAAVTILTSDASSQMSFLQTVLSLHAAAVLGGPTLVADLRQALQVSAASDQDYATSGPGIASSGGWNGSTQQVATWSNAQQTNTQTTTARNAFVRAWNPLATPLGLATFQANQL